MKQEIKQKWLTALRSGEYKQGARFLCKQEAGNEHKHYCCLGVLAKVVGEKFDTENPTLSEVGGEKVFPFVDNKLFAFLPDKLMRKIQLDHKMAHELAIKNDRGETFEDIARYIERNL